MLFELKQTTLALRLHFKPQIKESVISDNVLYNRDIFKISVPLIVALEQHTCSSHQLVLALFKERNLSNIAKVDYLFIRVVKLLPLPGFR